MDTGVCHTTTVSPHPSYQAMTTAKVRDGNCIGVFVLQCKEAAHLAALCCHL
jgi:hypothetical protein